MNKRERYRDPFFFSGGGIGAEMGVYWRSTYTFPKIGWICVLKGRVPLFRLTRRPRAQKLVGVGAKNPLICRTCSFTTITRVSRRNAVVRAGIWRDEDVWPWLDKGVSLSGPAEKRSCEGVRVGCSQADSRRFGKQIIRLVWGRLCKTGGSAAGNSSFSVARNGKLLCDRGLSFPDSRLSRIHSVLGFPREQVLPSHDNIPGSPS